MRLIDPNHPFYQAAWRRYLLVVAPFAWAGIEWSNGQTVWAYLFAAIGGYLAWHLIIAFRPSGEE